MFEVRSSGIGGPSPKWWLNSFEVGVSSPKFNRPSSNYLRQLHPSRPLIRASLCVTVLADHILLPKIMEPDFHPSVQQLKAILQDPKDSCTFVSTHGKNPQLIPYLIQLLWCHCKRSPFFLYSWRIYFSRQITRKGY
ncbi:uncharacterized protein PGTG_10112 [Puccinia graminis f. sp. tritici CRL 75-36-700-3]|uniref:Uncharacterized protein n=1 Tax=Puccinia graminis f. sp. tritici (strain CRL 75-36-700-3 / race SCCL) TaxID=418459 RepID=E3KJB7_PUCGT|nr:uncharacterized protein PGTG_10112 [Puccinia graminis f. sp. tritici CRL 75-36-700-3]EFP84392.1 hypothetical protein PGTG_10112 [Puccinia graminis f. sp. tritici CRL 75-36-700-3]